MKWISLLLAVMLAGCAGQKPPKHTCKAVWVEIPCDKDTVKIYVPVKYVPPGLTQKVQDLKRENHLLRVEIDRLKAEAKKLKKLVEINEMATKLKKDLKRVKKEITE